MISPERMEEMAFDELYAECKKLHTELKFKVEYIQELNEVIKQYTERLAPFEDEYFKGLDTKQIAELAKKSIRLTTENIKLRYAIDEIEGICSQDRTIVNVCLISTQLEEPRVKYDIQDEILDIISKAKGEENAG